MARKLTRTAYQILYGIICDSMPHAQRQKFLDLRTNNPEEAWQIIESVWDENLSHIVTSFMKKEKEVAANGQTKLESHEVWEN